MKILDILQKDELILRVLFIRNNDCLVINCRDVKMPYFAQKDYLQGFTLITQEELSIALKSTLKPILMMDNLELKQIQETYNLISPIIPFLDDVYDRQEMIEKVAKKNNLTQATIRKYLKRYLVFQDKACLLKCSRIKTRELSKDEKNFRYILNKYFYTSSKRSLHCCYLYLLREKYSDDNGNLIEGYPPFHRFKYFYYQNRDYDNYLISRETKGKYLKDYRPLLGDTKSFFTKIGIGECDSTIADIWVLDEFNNLIGRPHITTMVCPYSHMILGYTIGFNNDVNSLKDLVLDVNNRIGCIPSELICDKGKEYVSSTFNNLVDLGVSITSLRAYNPSDKYEVEKSFDVIQNYFKQYLMNKGVIREDAGLRGAPDYRSKASITIDEFKRIMETCVEHFNNKRIVDVPYKYLDDVKPFAIDIFNKDFELNKDSFIKVDNELIELTLLPRTNGKFTRNGLIVNGLRYRAYGFINDYLEGSKDEVVAYSPNNVSYVYLLRKGEYTKFELIEKYFEEMPLENVNIIKEKKKQLESSYEEESIQSQMKLGQTIDLIAHKEIGQISTKNVRDNRNDYIKRNTLVEGK